MRTHFFLLSALLLYQCLAAQSKENTDHIVHAGHYSKDFIAKTISSNGRIPFRNIVVYDQRHDSSKLGYVARGSGRSDYSGIRSAHDWTTTLNSYFRNDLDPASNLTLVLAIRTFWLQAGIYDEVLDKKVIKKQAMSRSDEGGFCRVTIDAYVQTDSLVPYFQVDGVFLELYKFKGDNLEKFFYLPFDSIARRIAATDPLPLTKKRKKMSLREISGFYDRRLDIPVIRDTILKKGVFRTFEDFKNNRPSAENFRIVRGKITDELYIVNGKTEDLLIDFWGVCDDKGLSIKLGYSICTAIRRQNTFEIHGARHISNYHSNPQQGDLLRLNSMSLDRKILQLNMDTGTFY